MRHYLPDTNAYSAYASGLFPVLEAKMESWEQSIILSAIVLAEMKYGWAKARGTRRVMGQREFAA
jgi:predicted nucleic acid-binding protein